MFYKTRIPSMMIPRPPLDNTGATKNAATGAATIYLLLTIQVASGWIIPQLKQNVWVTLAKSLQQENLCMTMGSVDDPLSTCLVGIPLSQNEYPYVGKKPNPADSWDEWTRIFPQAPQEPQELDLLGSTKASFCVTFEHRARPNWQPTAKPQSTDVSPHDKRYNVAEWCNYTSTTPSKSMSYPRVLPWGVFLICGDRVWAGIPSNIKGGPCSLGQLTTLTPNSTLINNWKKNKLARQKRSLEEFDPNCDSQIYNWGTTKRVAVSIFLPWVAAAKALGELSHLGCWLSKQANATSAALSDLLADEETTRHATLQNRAAIDFLLLAHGHGCEDFEGLCCFNLSSHSTSIQSNIKGLQNQVRDIQTEKKAANWLDRLFGQWGVPEWLISILKSFLWIIIILVIVLTAISCFKKALQKSLGEAFLVNRKGGDVGGDPRDSGVEMPWEGTPL
ncbi:uncharacterized protein LOC132335432 [Haemorhous mexicanus]|uniref:uncharacterized protein LOC132335432 n=1 Tax=Haemorhous mexicanus TaxID=30427 RepID=UPI0028BD8AE5|nr:uncharacterized protein LOC132335432 [Haemorhous mexicanus]